MSIVQLVTKPMLLASRTLESAWKLRNLMSKREALRLARGLHGRERAELSVAGHAFRLRKGTTDRYTFHDVFLRDSVLFPGLDSEPSFIVDCGAHIGCTSLFFALKYPGCRIVSVEPDRENFDLLSSNLRGFSNVQPINAAVWDHSAHVGIANPGTNPAGFRIEEGDEESSTELRGLTIPEHLYLL